MTDIFDIAILGAEKGLEQASVLARHNSDLALAQINCVPAVGELNAFRNRIERVILGREERLQPRELRQFGERLFNFLMGGDVARLYDRLPNAHVRLNVLSNAPDLQSLPWEFAQEPRGLSGPNILRSVVRIVPTIGLEPVAPLALGGEKIRILLAWAEPVDQDLVSWASVKESIERTFYNANPSAAYELEVIEAANRKTLIAALQSGAFHIFHFSGHGVVKNGIGHLVLQNRRDESDLLRADELGNILRGRDVRLAVLSACDTATGDFKNDFAVAAETLVRAGIPAVVANQLPVFDATVAEFVAAMYGELLSTGDIDRAVGEGRLRLAHMFEDSSHAVLDWGVPTLYRHIAASQIFAV